MRHRGQIVRRLPYDERCMLRSIQSFISVRGAYATVQRAMAIEALASKEWRGATVYAMTCNADTGRGPHVCWLPARILWSLIDLRAYRCAYH